MNEWILALLAGLVLFLFVLSAFFSSSETALMAVNRLRLRSRADEGDVKAKRAQGLLEDTGRLLSGILLGNNFVNVLLASLATALAAPLFGELAPLYVSPILTILLLIFAEILPKTLAVEKSMKMARFCAGPIYFFIKMASPLISLITVVCDFLLKPFLDRGPGAEASGSIKVEDLLVFADVGHEEGSIEDHTRDLIQGLYAFSKETVNLVMVPRREMVSMPLDAGRDGFADLVKKTGHTRIPVWQENDENPIGILHAKDLLLRPKAKASGEIRALLRPGGFIPESTTLVRALRHMQESASELLFVVDEYGGLEGLVTMKDLLEELVGDIEDEHDNHSRRRVNVIRPGTFIADGRASLRYIQRKTGIDLTCEGVNTLGGLVVAESTEELTAGYKFTHEGTTFTVMTMEGRFLKKVRVDAPPPDDSDDE